jgi:hypothetical protein
MPVDPAVNHQSSGGNGSIFAAVRQIAREQRHFESTGHGEDIDLICRDHLAKPIQSTVDNLGMPVGLDEGIAGWGCSHG